MRIIMLAAALLTACVVCGKSDQKFTLIWRESSKTPIEKVEMPKGFKISPAKAVKPIMARSSRPPWAEFYLFVDTVSYYFGNTRRGTQLNSPEPGHWIINGTTGKTIYVKENTEPKDALILQTKDLPASEDPRDAMRVKLGIRRVQVEQELSATPPKQKWVPDDDILDGVLDRFRWRMSEKEFKEAFAKDTLVEGKWELDFISFRKKFTLKYPNTDLIFEFSGVVDHQSQEAVPISSSLISFRLKHPLKKHPGNGMRRPPDSLHYRFIKRLHDRYVARLDKKKIKYDHEKMFHSGIGYGYMFWERIDSETTGKITFTYWSPFGEEGVQVQAPPKLIEKDIDQERNAASIKTQDWPIPRCGNDPIPMPETNFP